MFKLLNKHKKLILNNNNLNFFKKYPVLNSFHTLSYTLNNNNNNGNNNNAFDIMVNGKNVEVNSNETIYDVCTRVGIPIPTLCHHPRLEPIGHCRVCLVESNGRFQPACTTTVSQGMEIVTNSDSVRKNIQDILSLLLADHSSECATCNANGKCDFQDLIDEFEIKNKYPSMCSVDYQDHSSASVQLNMDKCIRCSRCIRACSMQGMDILGMVGRGVTESPVPSFGMPLNDTMCIECGQCTWFCPTGAIKERTDWRSVLRDLRSNEYIMIAQTAPSVRITIGEAFGMAPGELTAGAMVDALRQCGFNYVFDTNFAADLTIMEEGFELLNRLTNGGVLPQFTSCCPGWINMVEKMYPELIPNLSSAKSPQQMLGAAAKNFYAKKIGVPASKIKVVSFMPCTAKKSEAERHHSTVDDGKVVRDVDYVLTTREMAKMFRHTRVHFDNDAPVQYDSPLGESTGAALIFGASGGVMEAALRTAYEVYSGKSLEDRLDFTQVRGLDFIKKAAIDIPGADGKPTVTLKVAVVNGAANTQKLLKHIKETGEEFHFIEVMQCPGGCIGGGGQPQSDKPDILKRRVAAVYSGDKAMKLRKSHENKDVQKLYEDWLGEPLSDVAHKHLHTHYHSRKK